MNSGSTVRTSATSSVERCLVEIRKMILNGDLLPGEKVHQADLAEQLDVSRIPLREALSTLQAEGVLTHRRNSGYQVERFNSGDLKELYLMRRALENELLRTATLSPVVADSMQSLNEELSKVDRNEEQQRYQSVNQAFHFVLFETSPLRLVREEVSRLWYRSSFYRSLLIHQGDAAERIFEDHDRMIAAARDGDIDMLIEISDEHRQNTELRLTKRLGGTPLH
ncbi:GntR family transcriptional regulator [Microbacterium profundi]|uniref:GntR family transcriptional regulator n=1 Tax=Microbacterium profundi TaxID=450380 RepID=A0ABV3LD38_9MICO